MTMPTPDQVRDALRTVMDPELGINIVDLGLVYAVDIDGQQVRVTMTLTTPGCPLHGSVVAGVETAVAPVAGGRTVDVQLVWQPPWSPERMSEAARLQLQG